jgi:hypothetical protein
MGKQAEAHLIASYESRPPLILKNGEQKLRRSKAPGLHQVVKGWTKHRHSDLCDQRLHNLTRF